MIKRRFWSIACWPQIYNTVILHEVGYFLIVFRYQPEDDCVSFVGFRYACDLVIFRLIDLMEHLPQAICPEVIYSETFFLNGNLLEWTITRKGIPSNNHASGKFPGIVII